DEPVLASDRDRDLVAALDEPAREHVAIHLVVFDDQDLRHQRSTSRRATLPATSRRTSASNASRVIEPFCRIRSTDPLRRRLSSSVSSLAVTTTTGTACAVSCRRSSARNSKPSIS